MKEFVARNQLPWPQYYQGNASTSEFSSKWGMTAIPALFVVGRDGNLVCATADGSLDMYLAAMLKLEATRNVP